MQLTINRRWMLAASAVAVVPVGSFIFFAVTGGAIGAEVVLRVLPIAALVVLGWFRPQTAGWALIVLGIVFAGLYAATVRDLQPIPTAIVALIFCIPLIASGALFVRSHQISLASV